MDRFQDKKAALEEKAEILQPLLFTTLLGPLNSRLRFGRPRPRSVFADATKEFPKVVTFADEIDCKYAHS